MSTTTDVDSFGEQNTADSAGKGVGSRIQNFLQRASDKYPARDKSKKRRTVTKRQHDEKIDKTKFSGRLGGL